MKLRLLLAFALLSASAFAWLDPSWQYRVPITLNNSGGGLTDYQVSVTLDTASPISAGKMRSNCGDLMFANSTDGNLSYWIESGCNTTSTKAWVRVPSVPNGTSTIYAYYGNPNVTGSGNGSATFDFFDDFPGSSLDPAKWTSGAFSPQYGTGSVVVSNSVATVTGGTNTWWGMFANGAAFATPPFTVEFLYKGENGPHVGVETTGTLNPAPKDAAGFWYDGGGYGSCNNNACNTEGTAPPISSYSLLRMDVYGGGIKYFVNRSLAYTKATNVPDEGMKVYMAAAQPIGKAYADWVFIRKYASAEPSAALLVEERASDVALLGVSPASKEAPPSTNVTFTLYAYNNQTISDSFTLSCTGTCYYSENPVVTTSYQNKSVMVTITSGGSSGTTAYAITAVSQANASRLSYVSASITVDPSLAWWDRNWTSRVLVYLNETQGLARYEPVQVSGAAINALAGVPVSVREIRVITAQEANLDNYSCANSQCEIRYQVEKANGAVVTNGTLADTDRMVFMGTAQANSSKKYFLYFGNPAAAAPNYTDPGFTLTTSAFQTLKLGSPFDQSCRGNGGSITDINYVPKATVVSGYAGELGGGGCCAGVSNPRIVTDGPVRKTIQFSNGAWIWNWAFYRNTEFFDYANVGGVPSAYGFGIDRLSTIFNYYTYGSASPAWAGYGGGTFAASEGWEAQYASGNGIVYGTVWNQSQANSVSISYDSSDCCNCAPSDRGPSFSIGNFNSNATVRTYVHNSTDWNDVRNDWRAFMSPLQASLTELQQLSTPVLLSISPASSATYPGTQERFTLWVYNNQSIADNFTLSCTGTCTYSENPVVTASRQNKSVNMTITSPNLPGASSLQITATSASNPWGYNYASVSFNADWWYGEWAKRMRIDLSESLGLPRTNEPVQVSGAAINALAGAQVQVNEIRVITNYTGDLDTFSCVNGVCEIRYQVEKGNGTIVTNGTLADSDRVVFLASVPANSVTPYYIYFGNPFAAAPSYGDSSFTLTTSSFRTLKLTSPFDAACRGNGGAITGINYIPKSLTVSGYAGSLGGGGCCAGVSNPRIISDGPVKKTIQFSNGAWVWTYSFYRATEFLEYSNTNGGTGYSFGVERLSTIFDYYTYGSASPAWAGYGGGTFAVTEGWEAQYASGSGVTFGTVWNESQTNSLYISYDPSDCCNCAPSDRGPNYYVQNLNGNTTIRVYVHSSTGWNDTRNDWRMFKSPLQASPVSVQGQTEYVKLSVSPAGKTVPPNSRESFILYVYNNQNASDSIALSCTGTCAFSENPVVAGALQNKTVAVTITGANESGTTAYRLTAVSQANSSNMAIAYASLTVDTTTWRSTWNDAYNNAFRYRVPITITNSGTALSDYQVNVTLDTASLISAGRMRSNCADIRFMNGTHDVPYWLDLGCNTSNTKVWLKFTSLPTGSTTVYAYYGSPSTPSASNGSRVFIFFDNFDDGDISDWSVGTGTPWVVASDQYASPPYSMKAGASAGRMDRTIPSINYPVAVHMQTRVTQAVTDDTLSVFVGQGTANLMNTDWGYPTDNYVNYVSSAAWNTGVPAVPNAWKELKFVWKDVNNRYWDYYYNDTLMRSNAVGYAYYSFSTIAIYGSVGAGEWVDNVFIRKYSATEPVVYLGAEQVKGYRVLVRRCGLKQTGANVTAYYPTNATVAGSCLTNSTGICTLEISADTYNLLFNYSDNSTAWKNGTVFG